MPNLNRTAVLFHQLWHFKGGLYPITVLLVSEIVRSAIVENGQVSVHATTRRAKIYCYQQINFQSF